MGRATGSERCGFTLPELLVATVLLGIVLAGLHQAHLQQRRVSDWQQRVTATHDAFRVANAILSAELREAVLDAGDLAILKDDSMSIRSPLGFALVCDTRLNPAVVALHHVEGLLPERPTDSLLVYARSGWRALALVQEDQPGARGLSCSHGAARPEAQYRLERDAADDVPVGAPVRVFRRHRYHAATDQGQSWLARTDAAGTELLVGPLAPGGLRFRYLEDSGNPTDRLDDADAVEIRLILASDPRVGVERPDTLLLALKGRN